MPYDLNRYANKEILKEVLLFAVAAGIVAGSVLVVEYGGGNGSNLPVNVRNHRTSKDIKARVRLDDADCHQTSQGHYSCSSPEVLTQAKAKPLIYTQYETKTFTTTAYNSVPSQTDGEPCLAANGEDVCVLRSRGSQSAACPRSIPLGSKITVVGVGQFVCRDRLSRTYDHRVDLYFGGAEEVSAARRYGKQTKEVQIIYAQ